MKGVPVAAAPLVPGDAARRRIHVIAVRPHARQHGLLLPKEQEGQILIGDLQYCMPAYREVSILLKTPKQTLSTLSNISSGVRSME